MKSLQIVTKRGVSAVLAFMLTLMLTVTGYAPVTVKADYASDEAFWQNLKGDTYELLFEDVDKGDYKELSQLGTNGYFALSSSGPDVTVIDGSGVFTVGDGIESYGRYGKIAGVDGEKKGRISFTVSEGKYANIRVYAVSGGGIVEGLDGSVVIFHEDGTPVEGMIREAFNGEATPLNFYNLEPGNYYISRLDESVCPVRYFRIIVNEVDAPVELAQPLSWEEVSYPEITGVSQWGLNKIAVNYNMPIGKDGADYVEITMYDSDGNVSDVRNSSLIGNSVIFLPRDSDVYSFSIKAKRYTGEEKNSLQENIYCDFAYSLLAPEIYIANNIGGGLVKVDYSYVHEATSYIIKYKIGDNPWEIGAVSKTTEAKIYGLEPGTNVDIMVTAKRGLESVDSDIFSILVSEEANAAWVSGSYGDGASNYKDAIFGDLNTDDTIRIISNSGKIARAAADGMATSYTKVNADSDFTISAKVTVNEWTFNNGQNGAGIYVGDGSTATTAGWNNILLAGEQKIRFNTGEITYKEEYYDYEQANGIGVTLKTGVDKETYQVIDRYNKAEIGYGFVQKALEDRYNDYTNLIANSTNVGTGALDDRMNFASFNISINKKGNIYSVKYTSEDGLYENTLVYDLTDVLTKIDEEYVYVGLFAARNTDASFSEVKFTIDSLADYSELDALLEKINGMNKEEYVDFSEVDELVKNIDRTHSRNEQGLVDLMVKEINDAVKRLVKIPVETIDDDGTKTVISSTTTISGADKVDITSKDKDESYISIEADTDGKAPSTQIISGTEEEIIDSLLTDNEKNAVENGEQVSFDITVGKIEKQLSKQETKAIEKQIKEIEKALKKDVEIEELLDITIDKTVGKKYVSITETNSEIQLAVEVPESLTNKIREGERYYKILRIHDGVSELIDAIYDAKTNKLTFYTDRFSTYAIICESDAHEHVYSEDWTVDVEPTAINPGIKSHHCVEEGCNQTSGSTYITGWCLIDGKYYFYNQEGLRDTGWNKINEKWYFMNSAGIMQTGWVSDGGKWYYMNTKGAMTTGWNEIGGKWYYMNKSGAMTTGWNEIGGKWYYMSKSGAMTTGWQLIGGKWYYMNKSGKMVTGWNEIGGKWYYMNKSGVMQTGWQLIGGKYYYFYTSGVMASDTKIDGYYVNKDGVWVK